MTPAIVVALTDDGVIGFATVIVSVFAIGVPLLVQGRRARHQIGQPNGGGTIAGDVSELRGEIKARNTEVDRRLGSLDAGQLEILRRLPESPRSSRSS